MSHDEPDSFAPGGRLVTAEGPTSEEALRDLLHDRLRSCLIVLSAAFAIILVQGTFAPLRRTIPITVQVVVLGLLVLAAVFVGVGKRPLGRWRAIEAAVFGGLALYIAVDLALALQMAMGRTEVDPWRIAATFKSSLAYTTALIFTYAIYIPQDWRRALAAFTLVAGEPLVAASILHVRSPALRRLTAEDPAMAFENLALLGISVAASVFGLRIMNSYRTELLREREMNRYRLGRKLGAGGMGEVYMAEHRLLKRPCAVKLIAPKLTTSGTSQARFELEVRATARLSHWNIVDVYDYGRTDEGVFYYVMEYLPGLSLQELVDRHGPMPASRVIHLLRQVCDALREAHMAGLIHRDLKPPNLFAAYRGARYDVAKVLDFGLVKSVGEESPLLTLDGVVTGSPLYMAPELILKDRAPDGRVDVYSLGAVGYFLLSGRPPFLGTDAMAVMLAHAHDPVEPLSRHVENVPGDLEAIVLRCLCKQRDERFPSVEAMSRALASCRDAGGWTDDMAERWWTEREPHTSMSDESENSGEELASLSAAEFVAAGRPPLDDEPVDPLLTIGEPPA